MDGKQFHISLTCDVKPVCIKALCSISFAYRNKLKDEMDLLLSQNVIAPVITPKKNSDRIRMRPIPS